MKLSERLLKEVGYWPKTSTLDGLLREAAALAKRVEDAPTAFMDTRDALGVCAETEEDFPALYALQGKRVAIVPVDAGGSDGRG